MTELTDQPGFEIPNAILHDFRANRPFAIIYQKGLKRSKFGDFVTRHVQTESRIESYIRSHHSEILRATRAEPMQLLGNREYQQLIRDFEQIIAEDLVILEGGEVVPKSVFEIAIREDSENPMWRQPRQILKYSEDDDIFRLQSIYGNGFKKKVKLEYLLWRELYSKGSAFSDQVLKLARSIATARGVPIEAVAKSIENTPLIFITPSWIPALSEDALLAHKRGYRPGDLRFHKNGKPSDTQIELRVASEEEDYDLIVSAPSLLLESSQTYSLITMTFNEFLRGRKWLLETMI